MFVQSILFIPYKSPTNRSSPSLSLRARLPISAGLHVEALVPEALLVCLDEVLALLLVVLGDARVPGVFGYRTRAADLLGFGIRNLARGGAHDCGFLLLAYVAVDANLVSVYGEEDACEGWASLRADCVCVALWPEAVTSCDILL